MNEDQLDLFLENSPSGVVLYDENFKSLKLSRYIIEKTGFIKEHLSNFTIFDFVHEEDAKNLKIQLEEFKNSDKDTLIVDNRVLSLSGKYLVVRFSIKK